MQLPQLAANSPAPLHRAPVVSTGSAEPQRCSDGHSAAPQPQRPLRVSPSHHFPHTTGCGRDAPSASIHPLLGPIHLCIPAPPPAARLLLFLAPSPALSQAMAPYFTIITRCQRLGAGSQDRGGASTPLLTCHSVPVGVWASMCYFRKSNFMVRRSTRHAFCSQAESRPFASPSSRF